MKPATTFLFIFVFIFSTSAQIKEYTWGTSMSKIKRQETDLIADSENQLIQRFEWNGYQVVKKYKFMNNKLVRTTIEFQNEYRDTGRYLSAFRKINNKLTRNLGPPDTKNPRIEINSRLSDDPTLNEGEKIHAGAVGYQIKWKNAQSTVRHIMRGNGYEVIHVVIFTSPNYTKHKKQFAGDK